MGIITKNNIGKDQGIEDNLCFSFPVLIRKDGIPSVMKNITGKLKTELKLTQKELLEERSLALKDRYEGE